MRDQVVRRIKLLLTILVVGLLLFKIEPASVVSAFASVRAVWMLPPVLLGVAMVLLRWLKWHKLVKAGLGAVSPDQTLASILGGMAFAIVTPARVGELSRVAFLGSVKKSEAIGLVLIDRFIDLCVILIFGAVGVLTVFGQERLLLGILTGAIAALVIVIFKLGFFLRLAARLMPIKRLQEMIESASKGLSKLTSVDLGINLLLTLTLTALDVVSFYTLVLALGIDNLRAVAFTFPLIMLTNLLPITISGLGVRESAAVVLFGRFAVPAAVAFNSTFLSYVLNSLVPAVIGIYFFRKLRLKPDS